MTIARTRGFCCIMESAHPTMPTLVAMADFVSGTRVPAPGVVAVMRIIPRHFSPVCSRTSAPRVTAKKQAGGFLLIPHDRQIPKLAEFILVVRGAAVHAVIK